MVTTIGVKQSKVCTGSLSGGKELFKRAERTARGVFKKGLMTLFAERIIGIEREFFHRCRVHIDQAKRAIDDPDRIDKGFQKRAKIITRKKFGHNSKGIARFTTDGVKAKFAAVLVVVNAA